MDKPPSVGILQLGRTYGLELTSVIVLAVRLFRATEGCPDCVRKGRGTRFRERGKNIRTCGWQKIVLRPELEADRWEAINDFIIRIERITTKIVRSRKGIEVPDLFKAEIQWRRILFR